MDDAKEHNARLTRQYMLQTLQGNLPKDHYVADQVALIKAVDALPPEKSGIDDVNQVLQQHTKTKYEFGNLPPMSKLLGGSDDN